MRPFPPVVIHAAQFAELKWGIPASVSIAQWAIESEWGEKVTGTNNCFGIKAKTDTATGKPTPPFSLCWTHETIHGRSVRCQQPFADYTTLGAAFDAHAKLLATGTPYKPAWTILKRQLLQWPSPVQVRAYVDAIGEVYATGIDYDKTIISFMDLRNLYQYDQYAIATQGVRG